MTDDRPWHHLRYVVIDVEGNGGRPPELVELAVVPIVHGEIGEPRSWLVRPTTPITWQARRVHGISNTELNDQPALTAVSDQILDALGDAVPAGHNVRIDLDVLARGLPQWQPGEAFDTLRIARALVESPSHRLGALVELRKLAEGIPSKLRPHRASYDALVTARLLTDLATNCATSGVLTVSALREIGGFNLAPYDRAQRPPTLFE